ncbi:MAG: efflux RND transporter periplasmic adaptor subunit [Acidobacteria bacterium]|nr:efflux RND transporter periplasmic adaptor subunit [Acidobacteriota bacterium]
MRNRIFLFVGVLVCSALLQTACNQQQAGTGGAPGGGGGKGKKGGEAPVVVVKAVSKDVPMDLDVIGNVEASSTVSIKPQVSGELKAAFFKEGDFVKAGDKLFEIDKRTLSAQLDQATANLARSEAQLRQATANLARDMAQADYLRSVAERNVMLMKEGIASKEQGAQASAQAQAQKELTDADRAAIESSRADIAAKKATLDNLRVQLGFTTITAPITGRTGTLMVKPGNIVSANSTELMTVSQIQPVNVTFAVPESQFTKIASRFGKERISVFATHQDTNEPPKVGTLTFLESSVDATTGTLRLRASFPNADRTMWPGQFVRVRMRLGVVEGAVVVPNQAVQTGQDGSFVYVVKQDRSVENRPVTLGVRNGMDLVIAKGLAEGETVVTEGQLRIAPGLKVNPRAPGAGGGGGKKKKAE